MQQAITPIDRITNLINHLDERGSPPATNDKIILRTVDPNETINDALEEEESTIESWPYSPIETSDQPPFTSFGEERISNVSAVDSGIVRLGETENGIFIALRGAIVKDFNDTCEVSIFRTGPLFLSYKLKVDLLYKLGLDLQKPDLFVEIDESQPDEPKPIKTKRSAADTAHQYADRFRNWFERMLQLVAIQDTNNGIIVLDGALTLRTRDTPSGFLSFLSTRANALRNSLVAISKQSKLQIQNKSIQFWLDEFPNQPGYRRLSSLLANDRRNRVLGNLYASRFTPAGSTFRMDVKSLEGQNDKEVIDSLYNSCLMKAGYPDILVRAHAYSYFSAGDVLTLQSYIRANYHVIPRFEINLTPIFAPFGGRFK
jgi:hypothetical protein